jgi:hypothetical protein
MGFLGYVDAMRVYRHRLGVRPGRDSIFEAPQLFDVEQGAENAPGILYWYCD